MEKPRGEDYVEKSTTWTWAKLHRENYVEKPIIWTGLYRETRGEKATIIV